MAIQPSNWSRIIFVDLGTGLNAGWLSAASGISLNILFQHIDVFRCLTTSLGSAGLLAVVGCVNCVLAWVFGGEPAPAVGFGYALATSWACFGITKSEKAPTEVKY